MKIFDLFRLSLKNLKGRWSVLPAIGIAISTFCLSFAGAVMLTVQQEKSLPYVIEVSAAGNKKISDSIVDKISKISDVTVATAVLKVPVSIKTGQYSADMMLTGVDASFVKDKFAEGGIFPSSSVMPYIVLNKAACKLITNQQKDGSSGNKSVFEELKADTNDDKNESKINWFQATFSLQLEGVESSITSKICGILEEEKENNKDTVKEEPTAYISLPSAKGLLLKMGQKTDYVGIKVRIKNIGCVESVSKAIEDLGLTVTNADSQLQSKWDNQSREMTYLIVIGIFSLLCSSVLMASWRKTSLLEQKDTWMMLRWIGVRAKDIRKLFLLRALIITVVGIAIGEVVSTSLPAFLQSDNVKPSIYQLKIPALVLVFSAGICMVVSMLPVLKTKEKI